MRRKIMALVTNKNIKEGEVYISRHHNKDNDTEMIRLGSMDSPKYIYEPTSNFKELPRDVAFYEFENNDYYLLALVDRLESNKSKKAMEIYWKYIGNSEFDNFDLFYCQSGIYPIEITEETALLKWYSVNKKETVEKAHREFYINLEEDALLIDGNLL